MVHMPVGVTQRAFVESRREENHSNAVAASQNVCVEGRIWDSPSCITEQEAPTQEIPKGSLAPVAISAHGHGRGDMFRFQEAGIGQR